MENLFEKHQQKMARLEQGILPGRRSSSNTLFSHNKLQMGPFNSILSVQENFVDVEPRVTMEQLVQAVSPHVPPVVPEFRGITVGGAIMGAALESSSWNYGQFNDCCLEYDLLLGDGRRVTVQPGDELFDAIPGSYGTLGILTRARLRLIKAKGAVRVVVGGDPLAAFAAPDADFLEGVIFSDKRLAIRGYFCDDCPTHRLSPTSSWFYQLVQKERELVLSLEDYLFRWDRGAFWMGRYLLSWRMVQHALLRQSPHKTVASIQREPSPLFCTLLGWACTSQRLYRALHSIPQAMSQQSFFIHDFYLPPDKVEPFLGANRVFPVWLCPIKGNFQQFLSPHYGHEQLVNVGIYGPYQPSLDQLCTQLGGRKMLYSGTHLERQQFEKIYCEEHYQKVRKKFSAEKKFPHLYDKVAWNLKSTPRTTTTSATT